MYQREGGISRACVSHAHISDPVDYWSVLVRVCVRVCVVITLALLISQTVKARRHPVLSRCFHSSSHLFVCQSIYLTQTKRDHTKIVFKSERWVNRSNPARRYFKNWQRDDGWVRVGIIFHKYLTADEANVRPSHQSRQMLRFKAVCGNYGESNKTASISGLKQKVVRGAAVTQLSHFCSAWKVSFSITQPFT